MQKKGLRLRISYEPNRMANNYLSIAYEALMPIVKQSINSTRDEVAINDKEKFVKQLRRNSQ